MKFDWKFILYAIIILGIIFGFTGYTAFAIAVIIVCGIAAWDFVMTTLRKK